jgi:hypothetical protein
MINFLLGMSIGILLMTMTYTLIGLYELKSILNNSVKKINKILK